MRAVASILVGLTLAGAAAAAHAGPPESFREAKRIAYTIERGFERTFYCGCRYTRRQGRAASVDWSSCGYEPRRNARRGARVEWEHVVPAWAFGHQRQCWQRGGRKHCRKVDPVFRKMEADLHNLRPAVGELNADRSHYRFGMIEGEPRQYGACDFEVDRKHRVAEPRPEVRGDIARVYLYMAERYGVRLSPAQRRLFAAWRRADPVDAYELERTRRAAAVMGWSNPYVLADHEAPRTAR